MTFVVVIREIATEKEIKRIPAGENRRRVEDGANRNLNHDTYYTEIIES